MPLYLGIDAGGTKTDCAVSNGAELLGQATGPSCKLARVGREKAQENLQSTIRRTCAAEWPAPRCLRPCSGPRKRSATSFLARRSTLPEITSSLTAPHSAFLP